MPDGSSVDGSFIAQDLSGCFKKHAHGKHYAIESAELKTLLGLSKDDVMLDFPKKRREKPCASLIMEKDIGRGRAAFMVEDTSIVIHFEKTLTGVSTCLTTVMIDGYIIDPSQEDLQEIASVTRDIVDHLNHGAPIDKDAARALSDRIKAEYTKSASAPTSIMARLKPNVQVPGFLRRSR